MEYFYTPPSHIVTDSLTIEGEEFAHLTHVMRKKTSDAIRVVDGIGNAYDVVIQELNKHVAHCAIQSHHHRLHEPSIDVTLAVGVLKNHAKFDFLVEKCTELGVNTIIPLLTERTIPHHGKTDRWQKLALAAMKQCGRCVLPHVSEAQTLDSFLKKTHASSLKLIPHEKVESPSIMHVAKEKHFPSAVLCVGPEGGFTENEVARAITAGFSAVSLGKRRLRTETAAIAAVSLLMMSGER